MYERNPKFEINVFGTSGSGKSTLVKFLTMRSSLRYSNCYHRSEGGGGAMTNKLHGAVFRVDRLSSYDESFDIEEDVDINPTTGEQVPTLELRREIRRYFWIY